MFKMRQAQMYRNEAGDGSEGGAGGSSVDLNSPEIQAAIQAKIDAEVAGLKKKNSEVIGKLKETQEKMKQFDGLDVETLKSLHAQLQQNEELKLLAEGKTEEVVTRRVELLKKDYDNQIGMLKAAVDERDSALKQKEENLRKLAVDGTVREAYMTLGFEPTALDDVIRIARDVFIMDEHGDVVPRDGKGNVIFSKDGKSPITTSEWLNLLSEKKPYLKGVSKGAGAQGNRSSGSRNFAELSSTGKIAEGLKKMGFQ